MEYNWLYSGVSENMGLARSYVNFEMASEDELRLTTVYVEKTQAMARHCHSLVWIIPCFDVDAHTKHTIWIISGWWFVFYFSIHWE